jgi:RND family efflux transporter MFP subunit
MRSQLRHCLLLLGLATLAAQPGCGSGSKGKGGRVRPPPLVSVVKVTMKDVDVEARAPVDLRPMAQADISSKTLGYLDAVLVDRGDHVKRGQLLALVRPSDLPDQLSALRGTLAQVQANLSLSRANSTRAKQLAPSGVVSQQELENSASAVASGEANEAAIKSQISAIATRLGETRITSPIDGYVWARRLDPGALVGQAGTGGVILTVVQIDPLRIFVSVNERQAAGVRVGKAAYVELDALPGKRFEGKVVRLAPGFDPTTRTLDAEVRIPNPNGELRPGMYGRGAIVLETHPKAAVVTANAIQISNDRKYVFVLKGDKVERRDLTVGFDAGTWLEIVKGLTPGDEVVTAGADGLATGTKVRVTRGTDPYSGLKVAEESKDARAGGDGGAASGKR